MSNISMGNSVKFNPVKSNRPVNRDFLIRLETTSSNCSFSSSLSTSSKMLTLIEVVFFQELCRCRRRRRRRRRSLATRCVCTEYCLLLCVVIIVAVVRIPWMLLPVLIIIALKVTEEGQRRALFFYLPNACLSVCLSVCLLSFIFRKQKPENVDPKEKPREEKKKKKQREDGGGGAQTTKQQTK